MHEKEYSYLVGPQFRFVNKRKVQAQFKLNVGGAFSKVNLDANTTPAATAQLGALGYGAFTQTKFGALFAVPVDVAINWLIAVRIEPGLYLTNFNQSGRNNFRIGIGPVFRFDGER